MITDFRNLLLIFFTLIYAHYNCISQTNFKWDVKTDSLQDKQSQLYSKTKLFIAETWKSAKDVIQNDDANAGIILVKGISVKNLFYQLNDHKWTYSYKVKFMIKDNKCRIIIDDVACISAIAENKNFGSYNNDWPLMPVADIYPSEKGLRLTGINEERYLKLMNSLKDELQLIVNLYLASMQKPYNEENEW